MVYLVRFLVEMKFVIKAKIKSYRYFINTPDTATIME